MSKKTGLDLTREAVKRIREDMKKAGGTMTVDELYSGIDEREAFEKWLGIKPCGAAHDFGWAAWQARAALAATPATVNQSLTVDVELPELDAAVKEVMLLVQSLSDACMETIVGGMHEVKKALDAQIALESKLHSLLATGGHGQIVDKDESTWCSYIAGMIGCYLKEDDESHRVKAIAGIIERRMWALPTPKQVAAPQQADARDAERYRWLFGARTKEQANSVSCTLFNPLPQDNVLSEMQCFFFHKEQADSLIDAAIAAAKE